MNSKRSSKKFAIVGALVCTMVVIGGLMVHAVSRIQYQINGLIQSESSANSDCATVRLQPPFKVEPGLIQDVYLQSREAYLTTVVVHSSDTYSANAGAGCGTICIGNGSQLKVVFGNICIEGLAQGTPCRKFQQTLPVFISQINLECKGRYYSRDHKDLSGKFYYDGCANKGFIEFILPEWKSKTGETIRKQVVYRIALTGNQYGTPPSTIPCGTPVSLPSPTPN